VHSYIFRGSKWDVVFYFVGMAPVLIRSYATEAQAAAWASYLNGGNLPDNAAYGSPP
jgi:hypothetical protein